MIDFVGFVYSMLLDSSPFPSSPQSSFLLSFLTQYFPIFPELIELIDDVIVNVFLFTGSYSLMSSFTTVFF